MKLNTEYLLLRRKYSKVVVIITIFLMGLYLFWVKTTTPIRWVYYKLKESMPNCQHISNESHMLISESHNNNK